MLLRLTKDTFYYQYEVIHSTHKLRNKHYVGLTLSIKLSVLHETFTNTCFFFSHSDI